MDAGSIRFGVGEFECVSVSDGAVTGRYFAGKREARANRQAEDPQARHRLWVLMEQLCGRLLEPVVRR
jgi:hypothetical protein